MKSIANGKNQTVREVLLSLAREHVNRQLRAGFSVVPDFDSMSIVFCDDGSVMGQFNNIVDCKEVISRVSLSNAEAVERCSDMPNEICSGYMNFEQTPKCDGVIDLSRPCGQERVRGFQPPWRTVYHYRCPKCGGLHRVGANSYRGRHPEPSVGAIVCGR